MIENNVPGEQFIYNQHANIALDILKNNNLDKAIEYVHNATKGEYPIIRDRMIRMT